jgi:hypothetical protein
MTDLNDRIREALRADDEEALASLAEEPDLFEQVLQTFRGRGRALVFLSITFGVVLMALSVLCIVQFFRAQDVQPMLAWAVGFLVCFGGILGMKVWYWMELQKNTITREIKRLELQVARLAKRG